MFCSLIGLSPCDVVLQDIDNHVVRSLLQLMGNRFDMVALDVVKSEFDHVIDVIRSMDFDYESREDRILSKKLSVTSMSAFGDTAPDHEEQLRRLSRAKKSFTGNMKINGQVIVVNSDAARSVLLKLHAERARLEMIRDSIALREFSDDVFFGKPLTAWDNARSLVWLSGYGAERITRQDNLQGLRRDAERLLAHVNNDTRGIAKDSVELNAESVTSRYLQLSGRTMNNSEKEKTFAFVEMMNARDLAILGESGLAALCTAFVYSMLAALDYDVELADALEKCNLYFMTEDKADLYLDVLSNLTLVPEKKIQLRNLQSGDSYATVLGAIIAACDNDMVPIGASIEGGIN